MATTRTINGQSYVIPDQNDNFSGWGGDISAWIGAVTNGALYTQGGAFTLTNDVNFGANFGLVSIYFKSRTAGIANSGALRLANSDSIVWAGTGAQGDIGLNVNTANYLVSNAAGMVVNGKLVGGAGGANTNIQFNDNGVFGGNSNLVYDKVNVSVGIGNTNPAALGFGHSLVVSSPYTRMDLVCTGNANNAGYRWQVQNTAGNVQSSGIYGVPSDSGLNQYIGIAAGDITYQLLVSANGFVSVHGELICANIANNQILLNSNGANWGVLGSNAGDFWGLGYTLTPTSAVNFSLVWDSTGNVEITGISTATAHRDTYSNSGTLLTGTAELNCGAGAYQDVLLCGNPTVFFQNTSPAGTVTTLTLFVRQSANGGNTVTWGNTVRWSDNNVPVLSTSANTLDAFTFTTYDGGTIWIGGQIYGNVPGANVY